MSPGSSPRRLAIIDGAGPDAEACTTLLEDDGFDVTRDLDATGELLAVDCWTAETAPVVTRHRARGATVTSIGDLLFERTHARTFGITGSAGKTTATRTLAAMLAAAGRTVTSSTASRAGNAWPSAELVAGLPHTPQTDLVVELTSTHLAYMAHSPDVAIVTAFWPDHVELHGSLERYRSAKRTIVQHQTPDGVCIVNGDDPGAATVASAAPGRVFEVSGSRPVPHGIGVEDGVLVARVDDHVPLMARHELAVPEPLDGVVLTAACAALVAGADVEAVVGVLRTPPVFEHRKQTIGTSDGAVVIDSSAATAPGKLAGALAGLDLDRTVVICGGELAVDGPPVSASPDESATLDAALSLLGRVRAVVTFGPAAGRIGTADVAGSLAEACHAARLIARPGDTIVFAPMFPVHMADRQMFPRLIGVIQE